jgi:hypothetical protein
VVAPSARGAEYAPSPAPQSGGVPALISWLSKELGRIAAAIKQGRSQFLSLDVLDTLPAKPFQGQIAFFKAGVAGADEGLYEHRISPAGWHKL